MIRINNLRLELDDATTKEQEKTNLIRLVVLKYHIKEQQIKSFRIFKKAIDARHNHVRFIYNVDLECANEQRLIKRYNDISVTPDLTYKEVPVGNQPLPFRPIIIGFGPAGIFAALILARRGYRPLVLERGLDVDNRQVKWDEFLEKRVFQEEGSILFGEGGAGTFSDGKLTTLVNDKRSRLILETLVEAGANPEILYLNKPHVGTDVLRGVVKNIREKIRALGGEIRFGAKVTNFQIQNNQITQVIVNETEAINASIVLMAIGHSARDTFEMLHENSLTIQPKPFSVGVRIEHPQELINKSQYGRFWNHTALGAADYKLSYHAKNGRTAYSFCMCPGGQVVASISEANTVVTNGMSYSARADLNANSALLVNVTPNDYPSNHPLAGMYFQREIERKAFDLGRKNYDAPSMTVGDFLNRDPSNKMSIQPTYKPGVINADLHKILPQYVTDTLQEALPYFETRIKGFSMDEAILTGPETRSSSPIRILRNDSHESNIQGLYPMGEGAGYAGGIMSSAIDGIKTAENIIMRYNGIKQ
ncbi:MAG: hypothetical protein JXB08_01745 [Bacilli bacterium]|nr:hypothetical protein [Bacilli bacterium]MBN2877698.1 hypothetical protein [Bacilli bacterium]